MRAASAGRRATRKASQAIDSAAKSVSMCPASAISASDPETSPPTTSTTMKPPVSSAAIPIARALAAVINLLDPDVVVLGGGVGTVGGVVAGSFLFVALSELLRVSPDVRMIAYGLLLVVIVFACPEGILPLLLRKAKRRAAAEEPARAY